MGAIKLATSPTTDEEYGGTIQEYELVTSGIWAYKKYSDGTLEIWGKDKTSMSYDTNPWGGVYSHDFAGLGNYPIPFTSLYYVNGNVNVDLANGVSSIKSASGSGVNELTAAPAYVWVRGTQASGSGDVTRTIHAVGRWKN